MKEKQERKEKIMQLSKWFGKIKLIKLRNNAVMNIENIPLLCEKELLDTCHPHLVSQQLFHESNLMWHQHVTRQLPWCCCHFKASPIKAIDQDGGTIVTSAARAENAMKDKFLK